MRWRKVAAEHDRNAGHALAADQPYLNGCFPVDSHCDRYKPPLNEVYLLHWCAPMVQDLPGLEFDRFEKRLNALDLVRWESLEQAIMDILGTEDRGTALHFAKLLEKCVGAQMDWMELV